MSGHSKWSTIKHKKAAADAKRGKTFSMLGRMITVAVREAGSSDPAQNPRLRVVLDKARAANMPNSNVKKAVDRGLGKGGGGQIEEVTYEGYGPGGVGLMVKTLTDNRNRTGAEIKSLFERAGGSLGGPGCVAYMFERQGDKFEVKIPAQVDEASRARLKELVDKLEACGDVESVLTNLP